MMETSQGPSLNLEADHMVRVRMGVDGEVVQPVQTRQTEAGKRGQFTVLYGEVLELAQVTQGEVVQPRHVIHELRAPDGQRHGPLPGDHAEVGLVVLRVNCSETGISKLYFSKSFSSRSSSRLTYLRLHCSLYNVSMVSV